MCSRFVSGILRGGFLYHYGPFLNISAMEGNFDYIPERDPLVIKRPGPGRVNFLVNEEEIRNFYEQ